MQANKTVSSLVAAVCTFVLTFCSLGVGKTIRVTSDGSGDYVTIQAAIDASVDGDLVLVAPGTYTGDGNRDIDFGGRAITVRSETGPEFCVIQCGGRYPQGDGIPTRRSLIQLMQGEYHRGFYFHSDEGANSVVQGFTVTEGYLRTEAGGAFYCLESSPTIRACIITGNVAPHGGGIAAYDSSARVENCVIKGNVARHGGGIAAYDSSARVENCVIKGNMAASIPLDLDSPWYGYGCGGAMTTGRGSVRILNCQIVGNSSSDSGAGVFCSAGNPKIVNCTVTGNRAGHAGMGGGIFCGSNRGGNTCHLRNTIIWGNTAGSLGNDVAVHTDSVMLLTMGCQLEHSFVGGDPNDLYDPDACVDGRWITGDPQFATPGYWDPNGTLDKLSDDFWVDGDYHVKSQAGRWDPNSGSWVQDDVTSPCVDAGDPNDPIGEEPFPNGGRVNIGAYGGTAEASLSPELGPTAGLWSEPVPLVEINTDSAEEWSPVLSADGLTLYFGRVRGSDSYFGRILQATRQAAVPWCHFKAIAEVPGVLNQGVEHMLCPWISPDGLRMYYTHQIGSVFRLMVSERPAGSTQWPMGRGVSEINELDSRLHTCRLTVDELTIFFAGPDMQDDGGEFDIWMANRPDRDALFGEPVNLAWLNGPTNDLHATPSSDGLLLYSASIRNGHYQLFRSARSDCAGEFGPAVHMVSFDTPDGHSFFPCLSPDGMEFYFVRQTAEGRSTRDIWVSYRLD